ncbi:hypothetical protein SAMCCGM7_Ch2398 [Sinorhizobium americanum CCGM7]|nr:hypothetical protein SAMCCGM7_Ch2398 [Sinorhizobium americanum CCGM7]
MHRLEHPPPEAAFSPQTGKWPVTQVSSRRFNSIAEID